MYRILTALAQIQVFIESITEIIQDSVLKLVNLGQGKSYHLILVSQLLFQCSVVEMGRKIPYHFAPFHVAFTEYRNSFLHSGQTCHSERTLSASLIAGLMPQD